MSFVEAILWFSDSFFWFLDALVNALVALFSWPNIFFVVLGVLLSMGFGAIPGLSGPILYALLIPLTFGMNPEHAMILFGAAQGGTSFGGSVSAILLNVPGTSPNAATLLDGYPMTKLGRASEALSISATASAAGAVIGIFALLLLLPIAREVILAFGAPEFFWIALLGLSVIAVASGHVLKGLVAGGFGLMLAMIGYFSVTGETRFAMGTLYLWDGVDLLVALIGLFAIGEILNNARTGGSIANDLMPTSMDFSGVVRGFKTVFQHPLILGRSSITGIILGAVPGVGGIVPPFLSYVQTAQSSDDPDSFGKGNPLGVLASEAANDAKDGAQLLPTFVFGVPGGSGTAVLLGAFTLHGVAPGREMLTTGIHITMLIIGSLLLANILTSLIGIALSTHLAKLTYVPVKVIMPFILVICLVGAFTLRNNIVDVGLVIVFGLIGYAMVQFNFSRVAVILALILGPLAEKSFHQSLQTSGGDLLIFFRPVSLILFGLVVFSLFLPVIRHVVNGHRTGEPT